MTWLKGDKQKISAYPMKHVYHTDFMCPILFNKIHNRLCIPLLLSNRGAENALDISMISIFDDASRSILK